jgi:phage baseplate assembly protein W
MSILKRETRYSDLPINLTVHPVRGDLLTLENENAVKRSIKNLVLTEMGERFFQPTIGSGLAAYLFENITRDTASMIERKITEVITYHEKRANIIRVIVEADPDRNAYSATIIFSVINNPEPIKLNIILERVR